MPRCSTLVFKFVFTTALYWTVRAVDAHPQPADLEAMPVEHRVFPDKCAYEACLEMLCKLSGMVVGMCQPLHKRPYSLDMTLVLSLVLVTQDVGEPVSVGCVILMLHSRRAVGTTKFGRQQALIVVGSDCSLLSLVSQSGRGALVLHSFDSSTTEASLESESAPVCFRLLDSSSTAGNVHWAGLAGPSCVAVPARGEALPCLALKGRRSRMFAAVAFSASSTHVLQHPHGC
jgi:hypothetical protein